jgi:hypothetical protein
VGGIVCGFGDDGDWWSGMQQPAERAEWSNAARELFGDVQRYGERSDDHNGADSFHSGVKPQRIDKIATDGLRLRGGDISPWRRADATEIPRHYRNVDSTVWGQPSFLMLPYYTNLGYARD